jgi:putative PEP-CTERM system histidine kinase
MMFTALLAFMAAFLCGGLAAFVFWTNARADVHRIFAAGMGVLALQQTCVGFAASAILPVDILRWEQLGMFVSVAIPGLWLLFSLSFARTNYKEVIVKWRWVLLLAFAFPLGLVAGFPAALLLDVLRFEATAGWVIPIGWSGYVFHLDMLLGAVIVLMNLERTLRVSTGSMRWQIKFMILGVGSLFAVQIYTHSQVVLFSAISLQIKAVAAASIIAATLLMGVSLLRHRRLNTDIYLSRTALYNSITALVVGIYLLTVGVFAKVISSFGGSGVLPLETFFVFLTAVGLSIVLLSDQLRQHIKQFISRHVYRSRYDYRQVWMAFTQRTTSVMDVHELCAVVAKMVSETFGVPAVTLWLLNDDAAEGVTMGGSTAFSQSEKPTWHGTAQSAAAIGQYLDDYQRPSDFARPSDARAQYLATTYQETFRHARLRYGAPLTAGQRCVGFMTLNDRLTQESFSLEDFALLKTLADQAAASLLNLRLSRRLLKAKEMEAFQTLSAFFVHDLKNLAAKLSLMVQNLPAHYDNPAFRDDMLRVISSSVAKMNAMCSRLSLMTRKIELCLVEVDLNTLVTTTLAEVKESLNATLHQELHAVPCLLVDPEQLQKVLLNLVLNAKEAVSDKGEIHVQTDWRKGWAVLSVRDNGCGMSSEFITRSLFQPFQTTKSQGLGIGLFHSKMIVEAHRGRIEVESEEGKGSTFRVLLPGSAPDGAPTRSSTG